MQQGEPAIDDDVDRRLASLSAVPVPHDLADQVQALIGVAVGTVADLTRARLQSIRPLLLSPDTAVRTRTLRLLRHLTRRPDQVALLIDSSTDHLVVRSLDRDASYAAERHQAVRFVSSIVHLRPARMSRALVMSLVGLAQFGRGSDAVALTCTCLDLLRTCLLAWPGLTTQCNALPVIVAAVLADRCPAPLASSLILSIVALMDAPDTRPYIRASLDLTPLFACFTQLNPSPSSSQVRRARSALILMLRSWTGLLYLVADPVALRSCLAMLTLPDTVDGAGPARDHVFDLVFDLLDDIRNGASGRQNLLSTYLAMVVLCLVDCGLINALLHIGIHCNKTHAMQATSLLSALLGIAGNILPPAFNAKINALVVVIQHACAPTVSPARVRAIDMLTDLHTFVDNYAAGDEPTDQHITWTLSALSKSTTTATSTTTMTTAEVTSPVSRAVSRRLSLEDLALRTDCNSAHWRSAFLCSIRDPTVFDVMDESALLAMLKSTQVLASDPSNWDMSACLAIMQGPLLRQPRNLIVVLNRTKFLTRLVAFLHPVKGGLCSLPWETAAMPMMRLACAVTRALTVGGMSTASLLLPMLEHITDMLQTLSGGSSSKMLSISPSLLGRRSVSSGAGRCYLIMVGIMSESANGIRLMERCGLVEHLRALALNPALDYLTRVLASHFHYGSDPVALDLFTFWVEHGSPSLRQSLLQHLLVLMRLGVDRFEAWGLRLLADQVVRRNDCAAFAAHILQDACDDPTYFRHIVQYLADWKVDVGASSHADALMLRLVGDDAGLQIAERNEWVLPMIRQWDDALSSAYVNDLESGLVAVLHDGDSASGACCRFLQTTPDQEYYLDRCTDLPFNVDVTLEHSDGRRLQVATDCTFVLQACASGGLRGDVVASTIGASHGLPVAVRFDAQQTTLRATLSVGSENLLGQLDRRLLDRTCGPDLIRQAVVSTADEAVVADGDASWHFTADGMLRAVKFSIDLRGSTGPIAVSVAPHLFGELARTARGCDLIRASVQRHVDLVVSGSAPAQHMSTSLWTVGLCGMSATGLAMLLAMRARSAGVSVVDVIVDLARSCGTLSMRGTCLYVISLWSTHTAGRDMLQKRGWLFPSDARFGIALPSDLQQVLRVDLSSSSAAAAAVSSSTALEPDRRCGRQAVTTSGRVDVDHDDPVRVRCESILRHVSDLTNYVTTKAARDALVGMLRDDEEFFQSPCMYMAVLRLLATYPFGVGLRRFVHFTLFGGVVWRPHSNDAVEATPPDLYLDGVRRDLAAAIRSNKPTTS